MGGKTMENKTEVSYNPQLGYVQTIFQHKFDFLREVKSYAEEDGGACFTVGTHREQTATVHIQFAGENAVRFRMIPPSCEDAFDNAVFQPEVEKKVSVVDNGSQIVLSCGKTGTGAEISVGGQLFLRGKVKNERADLRFQR